MVKEQTIALALLAGGEGAHAYSAFLPSFFTTRTLALSGSQQEIATKLANLRSGYVPATLFALGLGGVVSYLAESPLPIVFAGVGSLAMLSLYEQALPPGTRLNPVAAIAAGVKAGQAMSSCPIAPQQPKGYVPQPGSWY